MICLDSFIEECYDTQLRWKCQRFRNNKHQGNFTDVELLTCYFFSLLEEQKYQVKKMHEYIEKFWLPWFPDLSSYQAFNARLNRLKGALSLPLGHTLRTALSLTGSIGERFTERFCTHFMAALCSVKVNGMVR